MFFSSEIDFQMYSSGPTGRFFFRCGFTQIHHTPTHTCTCAAVATAKLCQQVGEYRNKAVANAKQGCLSVTLVFVCACVYIYIFNTHAHTHQRSFRSRCPGLSVAVLNDANISNEIPIFSSREQEACVSSLTEG